MSTASILRKIKMPEVDERRANQTKALQGAALQQQVAQAPAVPAAQVAQQAQAIGAQQAQMAQQQQIAQAQQSAQQQQQAGQVGLGVREIDLQAQIARQQQALAQQRLKQEDVLTRQQRALEDKIFAERTQFHKDDMGRTLYQENQLIDLALVTAQSEEDLKNRLQIIDQETRESLNMMEALNNRLKQSIQGDFAMEQQKLDQASKQKIIEAQRALEASIAKKKADAANKRGLMQGIGTIGGAAIGSIIPGAGTWAGAALGASVGGAVGTMFSGF